FVPQGDGDFSLVRAINSLPGDTLLRGLQKVAGRDFFSYQILEAGGGLRALSEPQVWHQAAVHDSPADTGGSALADSIKLVQIGFTVTVRGRRFGESVQRNFAMGVALKNAGLIRNPACGDPPQLGVTPEAAVASVEPPAVSVSWSPAVDERAGESDVRQYTLYRRTTGEPIARPVASLPPDPGAATYTYVDADVEPGVIYTYFLGATDCTPAMSPLAQSPAVTVPTS
ncbi:MAG TPA: hypothetical protein VLC48_07750, partial [Gemmatimonadota bacterium]|nr:hypothetical protein [Gemmatimonadota bacterium]